MPERSVTPEEDMERYELDFRVEGREYSRGKVPGGNGTYTYEARYQDIVQDERIVYAYDMHLEEAHISVSLGHCPAEASRGRNPAHLH